MTAKAGRLESNSLCITFSSVRHNTVASLKHIKLNLKYHTEPKWLRTQTLLLKPLQWKRAKTQISLTNAYWSITEDQIPQYSGSEYSHRMSRDCRHAAPTKSLTCCILSNRLFNLDFPTRLLNTNLILNTMLSYAI